MSTAGGRRKGELCCGHRSVSLESQPAGTLSNCHHRSLVTCPPYCSSVRLLCRVSSLWGRTEPDINTVSSGQDCLAYKKCLKLYVNMLLDSCWLSVCPLPVPYSPVPMGADPAFKLSLSHCPNLLRSPIQNQTQYCYHSPYWSLVTRPTGHWSLTLLVTSERLHAWLPAGLG